MNWCWLGKHPGKKWIVNGRCVNQVCTNIDCHKVFQVFQGGIKDADWLNGKVAHCGIPPHTTAWEESDGL